MLGIMQGHRKRQSLKLGTGNNKTQQKSATTPDVGRNRARNKQKNEMQLKAAKWGSGPASRIDFWQVWHSLLCVAESPFVPYLPWVHNIPSQHSQTIPSVKGVSFRSFTPMVSQTFSTAARNITDAIMKSDYLSTAMCASHSIHLNTKTPFHRKKISE